MRKKVIAIIWLAAMMLLPTFQKADAENEAIVRLPVIMYHHINKNSRYWNDYTIPPEKFQKDMEYLDANGYNVITARQLIDYSNGEGTLPENPIMLTFDDGFESFMTYALPVLKKYGMSAVMAVVGHYTDIYSESEDHNINYSHLSWTDLKKFTNSPNAELAIHTYNMHSLGARMGCKMKPGESAQQFRTEFNADLEKIENEFQQNLGYVSTLFAYPYGMYCDEAKKILIEHQYEILFTCDEKVNILHGTPEELYQIGRFNRPNRLTSEQFFSKLK